MALIKCPECGREISDKAIACIHCGYPLAKLGFSTNTADSSLNKDTPLADMRIQEADKSEPINEAYVEPNETIAFEKKDFEKKDNIVIEPERNESSNDTKATFKNETKKKIVRPGFIVTGTALIAIALVAYIISSQGSVESGSFIDRIFCDHNWTTISNTATCGQDGTITKKCTLCGTIHEEKSNKTNNHNWIAATCLEPEHCDVCGLTNGVSVDHVWIDATCTQPETCSICGLTRGDVLSHYYNNGFCFRCGSKSPGNLVFMQAVPFTIHRHLDSGTLYESAYIERVVCEQDDRNFLKVQISGKKTYDWDGDKARRLMELTVIVYDESGNIINSGWAFTEAVIVGETFYAEEIFYNIPLNGNYRIEICFE